MITSSIRDKTASSTNHVQNLVSNAYINAIPSSDGTAIEIFVDGVVSSAPIFLNVDPGTGPGGHKDGYALTLSGTSYIATAVGFAPGMDIGNDGDDTMEITTTTQSGVVSSGQINFQRAFVPVTQKRNQIVVDDGLFILDLPNLGNILTDTDSYVLVMSTNAAPGPVPPGYSLASSSYQMNPSGAIIESEKIMTLKIRYDAPLPNEADPHTLSVLGWNRASSTWLELGGDLFSDDGHLTYVTKRFRIYALATTPTWTDTFKEAAASGIEAYHQTGRGPGGTIILSAGQTSGSVTSIPITPTVGAAGWETLHFNAETPTGTTITVDLLDLNDNVILANVSNKTDLSSLSLASHPGLKLRANFSATTIGQTPKLHYWGLSWQPLILQPPQFVAISPVSTTNNLTTILTVTGSNFVAGAQLRLGDSYTLPTTFVTPNVVTATLSPGLPPGDYAVTVTNPDGQWASRPDGFVVVPPDRYSVYLPVMLK